MKKALQILLIAFCLLISRAVSAQTPVLVCSGTSNTVWHDDFGSGIPQTALLPSPNITNGYIFGNNGVQPGNYTIINKYNYYSFWHDIPFDHTPNDTGGYFLVIDGNNNAPIFYDVTVSNICPFTQYSFSTYAMNVDRPQFPSDQTFTFIISDTAGNQLATWSSPAIPALDSAVWKEMGFSFTSGSNTKLRLQVKFNQTGFDDFAFDDFQFSVCGPTLSISTTVAPNTCNSSIPLFSTLGSGYVNPVYQWKKKNNTGLMEIIPGATSANYTDPSPVDSNFYSLTVGDGSLSCPINATKEVVIKRKVQVTIDTVICTGSSFNGHNITGTYIDTFALSNGCDSIRTLNLTVNNCTASKSFTINDYTPVLSLNTCTNQLTVEDGSKYNAGDTVMIIQMKGAAIDSSNSPAFGNVTNYNNAGNYEMNIVKSKAGNQIILSNFLLKQYDFLTGKVQLIRVPYFQNMVLADTLTCLPWDGSKGGVLVLNVANAITMNADIDVSAKGFKGGRSINPILNALSCSANDYSYPNSSTSAAAKGESIHNISPAIAYGKGANANGGGGGNGHNSGGGGGGNAGAGGTGGFQLEACGNAGLDNRGIGGIAVDYTSFINKIFVGGGGGSGHTDNINGIDMNGGNGGGIAIIIANSINGNGHTISSNGGAAQVCNNSSNNCHDASGGGGAAGTILLQAGGIAANINIETKGGKGGDLVIFNNSGAGRIGPGGGGGGGMAWLSMNSLPAGINVNNTSGANGVILQDANNPWGANPGQNGLKQFNLKIPVATIPFKPNIDSVKISDSLSGCNTFNFKGLAFTNSNPIQNWQWNFGDGNTALTQNSIHRYSNNGNYTVKLIVTDSNGCKDSTSTLVNTNPAKAFDFSFRQDKCNPLQVTFAVSDSSIANTVWLLGDNNSISNISSPVHTYADTGTYTVQTIKANNGCTDTISKNISLHIDAYNIILTPDTNICIGNSKLLRSQIDSAKGFCWSPGNYLNNISFANPTTTPLVSTRYFLLGAVNDSNLIANSNFNGGTNSFSSDYSFSANPPLVANNGEFALGIALTNNTCSDHTTGFSNMLLIRTNDSADAKLWSQTVNIQPNTNYTFSAWIQSLQAPNTAALQFTINGIALGDTIKAPLNSCEWSQHLINWNSGNNNTAQLAIVNKNTLNGGQLIALDDLLFAAFSLKKDSILITIDSLVVKAGNDTSTCRGQQVKLAATGANSYQWQPGKFVSDSTIAAPIVSPASTTYFIVTGSSPGGCISTDSLLLSIQPSPSVNLTADSSICKNSSAQLFVNGGNSYSWTPANTLNNSFISNPIATPVANTTYYVTTTDSLFTCTSTDSVKISIRPTVQFTISPNDTVCSKTPTQLFTTGGNTFHWTPALTLNDAGIANPVATVTNTTLFKVNISDSVCKDSAALTTTIYAIPLPVVRATKSNNIDCFYLYTTITGTGANKYLWTAALQPLHLSDSSIASPRAFPSITNTYYVTGLDTITHCQNMDSVVVLVYIGSNPLFYAPSAFSPNGDGLNDCFSVKPLGRFKYFELAIFNRFGNKVFLTNDSNQCWDGTYKGQPQDPGNFVYYIKTRNECKEDVTEGNLLLIR